jgi:hypothetical protein
LLRGLEGGDVVIEEAGSRLSIPFASVKKAKLTLSAELLAHTAARRS